MADFVIKGTLQLNCVNDMERLTADVEKAASENGIWVKLDTADTSKWIIPFIICDSSDNSECDRIFSGVLYRDGDFRIADVSDSCLPDVERLLGDIIEFASVEMIEINIEPTHEWNHKKYVRNITPDKFCSIILDTPNYRHSMPSVKIRMFHSLDEVLKSKGEKYDI